MISCRSCRFSHASRGGGPSDGACRRLPPKGERLDNGQFTSFYPPINLDEFLCGEYQRRPLWWRLTGRTG